MSDTQRKRPPIGISDFKELREEEYYFVDKTLFIRDVIRASAKVLLLPRPRRFGKTLNLSMLRYFFEKSDENRAGLFDGLAIRNDDVFEKHLGRYPVIYLTFKDIKGLSWEDCYDGLKGIIAREIENHTGLTDWDGLPVTARNLFESVINDRASMRSYENSLLVLSQQLSRYHREQVVILIDEYDTPVHAGYAAGYYEEIISFMRNFLTGGLKDNTALFRGVLTGILRIAKESVFSGLNNLGVHTLLDEQFAAAFGFTEEDVRQLLGYFGMSDRHNEVSRWYDGYLFGDTVIYNPWSVLNYTDSKGKAKPYWVNTASSEIIDRLATRGGKELKEEIGQLLGGGAIIKPVYDSIVIRDLEGSEELLWSFLLFSGYLKCGSQPVYKNHYEMKAPNEEVRLIYEQMIGRWFSEKTRHSELEEMLRALENGDMKLFGRMLKKIVLQIMSYHDLGSEPEKVYHALVLGMLVWMSGKYEIRSNRESGYGRYDLMLKPHDAEKHGIIIEFKKVDEDDNETPEQTLERAIAQIEERKYAAELEAAGIRKILKIAVAFQGKQLWMRHVI